MSMSDEKPPESTTTQAPGPWHIEEPNKHYFQIVDATGNRICEFFPFAGNGGRGWEVSMEIARQIIRWERADHAGR
jgi:hypothetical protein